MRKEIGAGVVGTVGGGVILWILEPHKDKFPKWAQAFFDYLWEPIAFPKVTVWIIAFLFGYLAFEFLFNAQDRKKREADKATAAPAVAPALAAVARPQDIETMPAMDMKGLRLDPDEERVLVALTKMGKFADERKLQVATGLTHFRFEHAVGSLRARHFINVAGSYTNGTTISFKQDGREFAAQNNLDKR